MVHENPSAFLCVLCNKNFTRKDSLEQHVLKFHKETLALDLEKFGCKVCNFKTTKKSALKKHFEVEHLTNVKQEKEDNWLPCDYDLCNEAFLDERDLKFHHFKKHSSVTKCSVCEVDFETKREVIKHMNIAHNMK